MAWAGPAAASGEDDTETILRRFIDDFESAAAVGRRYLETLPRDNDRAALRAELIPLLEHDGLARIREREFAAGETVILGGWVLTRTEARICALAALA